MTLTPMLQQLHSDLAGIADAVRQSYAVQQAEGALVAGGRLAGQFESRLPADVGPGPGCQAGAEVDAALVHEADGGVGIGLCQAHHRQHTQLLRVAAGG